MRHIPESELHAYLDQALSRSQCVEIERHLDRCRRCQSERDAIAALRDRTTALLSRLAPPMVIPPPLDLLAARLAEERRRLGMHRVRAAGLAAGLLAAAGMGWMASVAVFHFQEGNAFRVASTAGAVNSSRSSRATLQRISPTPDTGFRETAAGTLPAAPPVRQPAAPPAAPDQTAPLRFAAVVEVGPLESADGTPGGHGGPIAIEETAALAVRPMGTEPELDGLWRTIAPEVQRLPEEIPMIPGLPVTQMRAQPGPMGEDQVTAVDQLLETGEIVRTLAGPAERVAALVEGDLRAPAPVGNRMTVTFRQGERMVAVTGPGGALGTVLNRVTPHRRY